MQARRIRRTSSTRQDWSQKSIHKPRDAELDLGEKDLHTVTPNLSEAILAKHLQPIRGMALAQAIFAAFELGILDELERGGRSLDELASLLSLEGERLRGLVEYLENESLVQCDSGTVELTASGVELLAVRPWYDLLVGGYAATFGQLPEVLKQGANYASRNGAYVGVGSCGISQHDALPMVFELLGHGPLPPAIVDIGCGDGTFLADIATRYPNVMCVGVEPDQGARSAAQAVADERGLDNFRVVAGDALAFNDAGISRPPGTVYITAFVLQELLEQAGEAAVVKLLADTFAHDPAAAWIVIEVDRRHPLPVEESGLALGYYNPYFLIHRITEQRLASISEWRRLFDLAGLEVIAEVFPERNYDSLGIKFGHLLRVREA
jgi:2-ketoarginine methyltransferase